MAILLNLTPVQWAHSFQRTHNSHSLLLHVLAHRPSMAFGLFIVPPRHLRWDSYVTLTPENSGATDAASAQQEIHRSAHRSTGQHPFGGIKPSFARMAVIIFAKLFLLLAYLTLTIILTREICNFIFSR